MINNLMCCHAHRVNCAWQEVENWYSGRLAIEPHTFLQFERIQGKNFKDVVKKPTVCNNYATKNY